MPDSVREAGARKQGLKCLISWTQLPNFLCHLAPVREAMAKRRPGRRQHFGLVAQEVKQALDAAGVDAAFYKVGPDGVHSLGYSELIAPALKAIQELAEQNELPPPVWRPWRAHKWRSLHDPLTTQTPTT